LHSIVVHLYENRGGNWIHSFSVTPVLNF